MPNLEDLTLAELKNLAKENNVKNISKLKKEDLITVLSQILINNTNTENITEKKEIVERKYDKNGDPIVDYKLTNETDEIVEGILDILPDGYGFLRGDNYLSTPKDVYLSPIQIKRFKLDNGDIVKGISRFKEGEKFPSLIFVGEVNGEHPEKAAKRKRFDELIPIYPTERLKLETTSNEYAMRMIDLMSPIGKGQRGMIVAPPKVGKTTLIKKLQIVYQKITRSRTNRITYRRKTRRSNRYEKINKWASYISTFDELPEHHVKVAEMVLERAKRLIEQNKDVVILLDSITRLARAYNLVIPSSGRTLSGGLDPAALHKPKNSLELQEILKMEEV